MPKLLIVEDEPVRAGTLPALIVAAYPSLCTGADCTPRAVHDSARTFDRARGLIRCSE